MAAPGNKWLGKLEEVMVVSGNFDREATDIWVVSSMDIPIAIEIRGKHQSQLLCT